MGASLLFSADAAAAGWEGALVYVFIRVLPIWAFGALVGMLVRVVFCVLCGALVRARRGANGRLFCAPLAPLASHTPLTFAFPHHTTQDAAPALGQGRAIGDAAAVVARGHLAAQRDGRPPRRVRPAVRCVLLLWRVVVCWVCV
jgi:hypothetical protein